MEQELKELEFLNENEIRDKKCDMERKFAFISYSHDDHDIKIVRNVFEKLYNKGYNLWIDTANIPYNEKSWKDEADEALRSDNCIFAFYFRSESSMTKETILRELETIINIRHRTIVAVDIWKQEDYSAKECEQYIKYQDVNIGKEERTVCEKICKMVSTESKAIRLKTDAGNDIDKLVEELEMILKKKDIYPSNNTTGNSLKTQEKENTAIDDKHYSYHSQLPKEEFSNFINRFKKISDNFKIQWQKNNSGVTPAIPVKNMVLYFPQGMVKDDIVKADSWKSLFNEMMKAFAEYTQEDFCAWSVQAVSRSKIITRERYESGEVSCTRYQHIGDGNYYFFNSYAVVGLLDAMKKEIKNYIEYLSKKRNTQVSLEEIKISYVIEGDDFKEYFKNN